MFHHRVSALSCKPPSLAAANADTHTTNRSLILISDTTSGCAGGAATSRPTPLNSRQSPSSFSWFRWLASCTNHTRVLNFGHVTATFCAPKSNVERNFFFMIWHRYPFGDYTIVMAKEDSLLLPPELVQVPDRRCASSLVCAFFLQF